MPSKWKTVEERRAHHRAYMREYLKDPRARAKQLARNKRNKIRYVARNKAIMAKFRVNGCTYCPEIDEACLDAHHTASAKKEGNVAKGLDRWSEKRLRDELKKCICVCANCHRKLHAGRKLKKKISATSRRA